MAQPKSLFYTLVLFTFFVGTISVANAQQLVCENLKKIVNVVATDSTMYALKGPEIEDKYDKTKAYMALEMLWDKESEMEGQYIKYDKGRQGFIYHAFSETEGTPGSALVMYKAKEFLSCLGNEWVLKRESDGQGDSLCYLKNPVNYVVIKIWGLGTNVFMDFYNDSKKSDECIYGDCDSYFGTKKYFNEDVYSGTFIDEGINGVGRMKYYADGTTYQGSFIDDQIAGYGGLYNEKNELVQSGIFFKGQVVKVDTTQNTCQYGDCQTGFGLKVIAGGFYVGNFKDGLSDGLGELIINKTAFYGHYEKNVINGKGILINAAGEYTFATYANGRLKGVYEKDFIDKTSKTTNADDGSSILYDKDNILTKAGGALTGASVTEFTDAGYLNLKTFAGAIKEFYNYRKTNYREIRGEQNKMLKEFFLEGYKSKVLFLNEFETNISADRKRLYYVTVDLTGKTQDKAKWISIYNKYYALLNKATGPHWTALTDDGAADANKIKANFSLQNIFEQSKVINLSFDNHGGVHLEIH